MWRHCTLFVGMKNGTVFRKQYKVSSKLKKNRSIFLSRNPPSENISKGNDISILKIYLHCHFIAALFTMVKIWKWPNCPLTVEGMSKVQPRLKERRTRLHPSWGEKCSHSAKKSALQGLCRDYGTHLHKQPFRGELDVIVKLLGLMCSFYPGWASLVAQMVKIDWNPGDPDSFPGSGRSSGEGNSYPLQYSCLENSTNKKTWRTTVHGVTRVRHD